MAMGRFNRERRPIVSVRSETARLVTLIGMLVVLYLLFHAARDPKLWRFFAPLDSSTVGTKPLDRPAGPPAAAASDADQSRVGV